NEIRRATKNVWYGWCHHVEGTHQGGSTSPAWYAASRSVRALWQTAQSACLQPQQHIAHCARRPLAATWRLNALGNKGSPHANLSSNGGRTSKMDGSRSFP